MTEWWTTVSFGALYDGPSGPWKSEEAAAGAMSHWRDRKGADAGSIEAASSLRVVGPFRSRAIARQADISDYPKHLGR